MHTSPPSVSRPSREWAAFTLVELLVVIAVIGILVAILLSVTSRARSKADEAQCISQLRQGGTAICTYINDHNGMLPGPLTSTQSPMFVVGQPGSLSGSVISCNRCGAPLERKPHNGASQRWRCGKTVRGWGRSILQKSRARFARKSEDAIAFLPLRASGD